MRDRASSSLLTLLLVGILVLEFGSLTMLQLERNAPNANITTAPDALWYLVVTMSTVGYGDRYPVSAAGRALGTFVIVVGVSIFGPLTGYLANLFISPRKEQVAPNTPPTVADARHWLEQVMSIRSLTRWRQAPSTTPVAMGQPDSRAVGSTQGRACSGSRRSASPKAAAMTWAVAWVRLAVSHLPRARGAGSGAVAASVGPHDHSCR